MTLKSKKLKRLKKWLKRLWDNYRDGANENSFDWSGRQIRPFPTRWNEVQQKKQRREAETQALCDLIHKQRLMDKPPSRFA